MCGNLGNMDSTNSLVRMCALTRARGLLLLLSVPVSAVPWSLHTMSFLHPKELGLAVLFLVQAVLVGLTGADWIASLRALSPLWIGLIGSTFVSLIWTAAVPEYVVEDALRFAIWLGMATVSADLLRDVVWRSRLLRCIGYTAAGISLAALGQWVGWLTPLFPVFPQYTQPMYSVFGNQNLLGGYLALAVPLLWLELQSEEAQARRVSQRIWKALLLGVVLLGLILSGSRSAWLAAAVGGFAAHFFVRRLYRRYRIGLAVLLAASAVGMSFSWEWTAHRVLQTGRPTDTGARLRLWFWDTAYRMWGDHFWFGVGLGNFPYRSPIYAGAALEASPTHAWNDLLIEHAHNEYLNFLAEVGLIGVLPLLWFVLRLHWRAVVQTFVIVSAAVFSFFSSPFHSVAHAWVVLLMFLCLLPETPRRSFRNVYFRYVDFVPAAFALIFFGAYVYTVFCPSALLARAELSRYYGQPRLEAYERAARFPWYNAQAHWRYSFYLWEMGRIPEAHQEALRALRGMDTASLYYWLAYLADAQGYKQEALTWAEAATARLPHYAPALTLKQKILSQEL